jgi:hypothetical protein
MPKQWIVKDYLYRSGDFHTGKVVCRVPTMTVAQASWWSECDGEPRGCANIPVDQLKSGGLIYTEWKEILTEVC